MTFCILFCPRRLCARSRRWRLWSGRGRRGAPPGASPPPSSLRSPGMRGWDRGVGSGKRRGLLCAKALSGRFLSLRRARLKPLWPLAPPPGAATSCSSRWAALPRRRMRRPTRPRLLGSRWQMSWPSSTSRLEHLPGGGYAGRGTGLCLLLAPGRKIDAATEGSETAVRHVGAHCRQRHTVG